MAFKTFVAGNPLPAADLNQYLMQQVVITCTSATHPSAPVEGMVIYETDANKFKYWTGTAWQIFGPFGILGRGTRSGGFSGNQASFAAAGNQLTPSVTCTLLSTRITRVTVLLPLFTSTFASGNGFGSVGFVMDGAQLGDSYGWGNTLSAFGQTREVSATFDSIAAGSHDFNFRTWCGTSVTQVGISGTAELTVEDLGPS